MRANICLPHLQSSHQQVNIMLSVDGVYTLADVVIPDPIQIDLVLWVVFSCGVTMTIVTQAKDGFYHD